MDFFLNALWSVIPTIVLALAFWFVMRNVLRQDRIERETYAKVREQEKKKIEEELGITFSDEK